jgi:hypothetical protein
MLLAVGFVSNAQNESSTKDSVYVEKMENIYVAEDGSEVHTSTMITWKVLPDGEKQKLSESRTTTSVLADTNYEIIEDTMDFDIEPYQNYGMGKDYDDLRDTFKNIFKPKDRFEATWAGLEFAYKNWQINDNSDNKDAYALKGGWMFRWNFFDIEIPLASNIGFFTGLGYESSIYYLQNPVSFLQDITSDPLLIDFPIDIRYIEDTRLVSRYINLPLFFEIQSKNKSFAANVGVIVGLNIYNRFKNDYDNNNLDMSNSVKLDNRFDINRFKADLSLRFAFKKIQIFGEYALVPMFKTSFVKVYPFTIGLNLAF